MTKFTQMSKNLDIKHNLGRVTNQLLHEQMIRTQYSTTKGDRINSASPDARHPARQSNNFVNENSVRGAHDSQEWGMDDPAKKRLTFNEMHSPIVKAASKRSLEGASPRVDLNPMVRASHSRREEARIVENERSRAGQVSRGGGSRNDYRLVTNSDANRSPYRSPAQSR